MGFPFIANNNGFTTVVNAASYAIDATHPKYDELLQAVVNGDADAFLKMHSKAAVVNSAFEGTNVVVSGGVVLYKGKAIQNSLTQRIINFAERDLPIEGMVKFLDNLMQNPSRRSVQELYGFLEHGNLPITDDGHFLAYKAVRKDYLDKFSGTCNNSVGEVLEMERNEVDDNANETCSHGYHVGALQYAGPGGFYHNLNDRVMIVKVNPRDAVSVPVDHSAQKLRVCRYEVIGEYERALDDDYEPSEAEEKGREYTDAEVFLADEGLEVLEDLVDCWDIDDLDCLVDAISELNGEWSTFQSHVETNDYRGTKKVVMCDQFVAVADCFEDGSSIVMQLNSDDSLRRVAVYDADDNIVDEVVLTDDY